MRRLALVCCAVLLASPGWAQVRPTHKSEIAPRIQSTLQTDYREAVAIGDRILKGAVTTSNTLSSALVSKGQAKRSFSRSQMENIIEQLGPSIYEITDRPGNGYLLPGPGVTKPVQGGTKPDAPKPDVVKPGIVKPDTPKPGVVAPVTDDALLRDTQRFNLICTRMTTKIAKPLETGDTSEAAEFVKLLKDPANKSNRWYFQGVVSFIVRAYPTNDGNSPVGQLASLLKDIDNEAKQGVKPVNWQFGHLLADKAAQKSFADYTTRKVKLTPMKRASASGSNVLQKKASRGMLGDMWDDICDNIGDDFQSGADIGEWAGMGIGAVAGGMAGFSAFGPYGITYGASGGLEAGGEIGQCLGGVVGAVGSVLGTTAGWIYGTIESNMAQYGRSSTMKRGETAGAPAAKDSGGEGMALFATPQTR